ncbi:MAG: hypothetical protein D6724_10860 [Armatimonadetes bacterium]|nr:MAG: hypothetical protein D6724_10860 [Armatimonadota bacterium]
MEVTEEREVVQERPDARTDLFGAVLGALTFLLGIGLLVLTFVRASDMFLNPVQIVSTTEGAQQDVAEIGVKFGTVVFRIGLLLVMSIVGAVISTRGVHMYFAARGMERKG